MFSENTQVIYLKNLFNSVKSVINSADPDMKTRLIVSLITVVLIFALAVYVLFSAVIAFLFKLILLVGGYFLIKKYLYPYLEEGLVYVKNNINKEDQPTETKE